MIENQSDNTDNKDVEVSDQEKIENKDVEVSDQDDTLLDQINEDNESPVKEKEDINACLLYTSPSPRDS